MRMPEPDANILAQRQDLVAALRKLVPGEGVVADDVALRVYESDGLLERFPIIRSHIRQRRSSFGIPLG